MKVYNVLTGILCNNINNFKKRYGVSFYDTLKQDFLLGDIQFLDNFNFFAINDKVECNNEGCQWEVDSNIVYYKYIVALTKIPIYNVICSRYNRDRMDISNDDLHYVINNDYSKLRKIDVILGQLSIICVVVVFFW